MRLEAWVAAAAAAAVVSVSWDAAACSPSCCATEATIPAQGSAPANLPAFYWLPPDDVLGTLATYDASMLTVTRTDTGEVIPVTLSPADLGKGYGIEPFFAMLSKPLVAGGHYRVDSTADGVDAGAPHKLADFAAGPFAPLPTSLGTLSAGAQTVGVMTLADLTVGDCSGDFSAAQVPVTLELSPEAKPWSDAFFYETQVDGKPYHPDQFVDPIPPLGASWVGRGKDLLFALCEKTDANDVQVPSQATEGQHTVVIHAIIPGTQVDVSSAPLQVTLDCNAGGGAGSSGSSANGGPGCGVSVPRPSGSDGYLVLVGLVWVVRRRRVRVQARVPK